MADRSKVAEAVGDLTLSYLAGLIDGEGCFRIDRKKGKFRPSYSGKLVIGMSGETIPRLYRRLRIGTTYYRKPQKKGWRGTWIWTLCKNDLYPILARLIPFLVGKATQATLLLELWDTHGLHARGKTDCEPLYASMKLLNKRGA